MGREEQLLAASIADNVHEARAAEMKVSNEFSRNGTIEDAEQENDALREAQDTLKWHVAGLYRDVAILAERMSLPLFASRISAEFDKLEEAKADLADVDPSPYDPGLYSPHLGRISGHFRSLQVMTNGAAVTGLDTFRTILKNTPAILKMVDVEPQNEKDVRKAVFDVLKIAFHDAVREIAMPQLTKTFKPDMGVRSLMAAAEYKFVESEAELKTALEGVYADMKGYTGYDWRTFYAVFYTTDAIVNAERLEQEFAGVKADLNWTPIVVTGTGGRKKRAPRLKKPAVDQ